MNSLTDHKLRLTGSYRNLASFNHGSAQNIDTITRSICDTLTNSCKADQTAKDTCAKASAAASAQTAKTGAQADAFNAAFNIETNFAAVGAIDDQGRPVDDSAQSPAGNAPAATQTSAASVRQDYLTSTFPVFNIKL